MLKFLVLGLVASTFALEGKPSYSMHTRFISGSLNLTTVELKQFAGHAMNIIKAKCPAVDYQKIFQVQKYIGKLLAKHDPLPGATKDFPSLLKSMTECEKQVATPVEDPVEMDATPNSPFFPLFPRLRNMVVIRGPQPSRGTEDPSGLESSSPPTTVTRRVISTTIFVRPEDMQEGIKNNGGFFNWIRTLFARMTGFIRRINPFHSRSKRDLTSSFYSSMPEEVDDELAVPKKEINESKGKVAFGALIDQMCRVYCDTCSGDKEMRKFQLAAKQLLDDLFEEDSGLDAAATQYLDDAFLLSIQQCH